MMEREGEMKARVIKEFRRMDRQLERERPFCSLEETHLWLGRIIELAHAGKILKKKLLRLMKGCNQLSMLLPNATLSMIALYESRAEKKVSWRVR